MYGQDYITKHGKKLVLLVFVYMPNILLLTIYVTQIIWYVL